MPYPMAKLTVNLSGSERAAYSTRPAGPTRFHVPGPTGLAAPANHVQIHMPWRTVFEVSSFYLTLYTCRYTVWHSDDITAG